MSGHNKWSTIKHKKAAVDKKRAKVFTKIIRELTVAAKEGGPDPDSNPRLRSAIAASKQANMPGDTLKRAIDRGSGNDDDVTYEEIVYEGYGPGGVAVLLELMTDNRNRAAADIRHIFSKNGGNLAENGAVRHLFEKQGYLTVSGDQDEDRVMEIALEAGALDMKSEADQSHEIFTDPTLDAIQTVQDALKAGGVDVETAELAMIPSLEVTVPGPKIPSVLKMMDAFEDHDDVQNVWANFDFDPADLED